MSKYKQMFLKMVDENRDLFESFKKTHDSFATNPKEWKLKFDEDGEKILEIIRHYENLLCSQTENGGYGKYSSSLSDKFWTEIRAYLPRIDSVGLK